jgi:hypothetical protein
MPPIATGPDDRPLHARGLPPPPLPEPAALAATARRVDTIVIHCSASASGRWLHGHDGQPGWRDPATVIDGWHAVRGFRRTLAARSRLNMMLTSIGYHWVVDLDGVVYTGRHPDEAGAHVAGHNAHSLGICLVGGAEPAARYTPEQWYSLMRLVRALASPARQVLGHRDLSPDVDGDGVVEPREFLKTCPGFDVRAWLASGMRPPAGQVITALPKPLSCYRYAAPEAW